MAMLTKLEFILFYSFFLFFMMQISAMAGQSIISGIEKPRVPTGIADTVISNFGYFFKMMGVSTGFGIFGTLILTPMLIGLIIIVIEIIRGSSG